MTARESAREIMHEVVDTVHAELVSIEVGLEFVPHRVRAETVHDQLTRPRAMLEEALLLLERLDEWPPSKQVRTVLRHVDNLSAGSQGERDE